MPVSAELTLIILGRGKGAAVRIMIVEDDIESATNMAEMLMRNGHDVVLSDDLYCLDLIKRQGGVDVVITDIFLCRRSGLQIVLDVKDYDSEIKVIAMSSGGSSYNFDYLDYAVEFGADAVMRKPLDETSVVKLIERFSPGAAAQPPAHLSLSVS